MKAFYILILTIVLCAVSLYLMFRDISKNDSWGTDAARIKKTATIYSAIVIAVTVAGAMIHIKSYGGNGIWANIKYISLMCTIWPVAFTDMKTYRIPNPFIIMGIVLRIVILPFEVFLMQDWSWYILINEVISAAALLIAAVICNLLIKNSVGYGDMKLFVVMGLLLGVRGIWNAIFLSLIISFVMSVYLMITKKKNRKDKIAFGPALVIGTYLSICLPGM